MGKQGKKSPGASRGTPGAKKKGGKGHISKKNKARPHKELREKMKREAMLAGQNKSNTMKPTSNKKKQKGSGHVSPYKSDQDILLVGDGNFSFAASLAKNFGGADNITATVFDDEDTLRAKYPDAEDHEGMVESMGGTLLYGIDCTNLAEHAAVLKPKYDMVVFNFPHTGCGEKDMFKNVVSNQQLIIGFLKSVQPFLAPGGEIHVTTKNGSPYDKWDVAKLGLGVGGLRLKTAIDFRAGLYPMYEHRRTLGFEEGVSGNNNSDIRKYGAKTFMFQRVGDVSLKKKRKVEEEDD